MSWTTPVLPHSHTLGLMLQAGIPGCSNDADVVFFGYPDDECANKAGEIAKYLPFYMISFSRLYSALPQTSHLWVVI